MPNTPNDHPIFARQKEQQILQNVLSSGEPEFVVVYGRRRIGKTYLISKFFQNKGIYFEVTGIQHTPIQAQLTHFAEALSDVFSPETDVAVPKNWHAAMTLLRRAIEKLSGQERIILFFDELPWLASRRSGFLQALDHTWNRYLSRDSRVILVICGSAAAWMIDHVINSRGGLHGRETRTIHLMPFNLEETEQYLQSRNIQLDRKQAVELYMAVGGVAKYLSLMSRGQSATQMLNQECFSQNGYLYREFHKLYRSLFDKYDNHLAVIRTLAKRRIGLTRSQIIHMAGFTSGGTVSQVLHELEESGFIMRVPIFGRGKHISLYRLIDEYSLFYLKWVEGAAEKTLSPISPDYWMKQYGTQAWKSWAGYAFENICLTHVEKIKSALGLTGVLTQDSSWFHRNNTEESGKGVQIDLVIDRADRCINLCEIKFHNNKYVLNEEDAVQLERKLNVFHTETQTNKALFTTLLTTYGAQENRHYHRSVHNQLTMEDLF